MATRIRLPSQRPNRVGPAPTQGGPASPGSVQVRNVGHQDNPSVYENRVSNTGQANNYISNGPNDNELSNRGPSLSVGSGGGIGIEGRGMGAAGIFSGGGMAGGGGGRESLYGFRAFAVQPTSFGGGAGPSGFNSAASPAASRSSETVGSNGSNGGDGPTGPDPYDLPPVPPDTPTADNNAPIMSDVVTTAALTELTTTPGLNYLSASNFISFSDADTSDEHFLTSITPLRGPIGTLTASIIFDSTGTGAGGEIVWSYRVLDSQIEYLAAGETKVEEFQITMTDTHGGYDSKTISITITGTEDAPVISTVDTDKDVVSLSETNTTLSTTGTLTVTDVDVSNTVAMSVLGISVDGVVPTSLSDA